MKKTNLETIRSEIEKKILHEDFQALINYMTKEEQQILIVLLWSNQALPIRTIRNYIISFLTSKYKDEIYIKFGLNPVVVRETIKSPLFGTEIVKHYPKELQEKSVIEKLSLYKEFKQKDSFKADLLRSFISDEFLLQYSIKPLSFSDKVKIWEKALKGIVDIPSWNVIKTSIENLVALGIVKERKVIKKKVDFLYFISPVVYKLWQKKKKEIHKLVKEKKYEPDETEKLWYWG